MSQPAAQRKSSRLYALILVAIAFGALVYAGATSGVTSSLVAEYAIRASAVVVVIGLAVWCAHADDTSRSWWVVPGAAGVVAGASLASALHGSEYAPGGIGGDQAFRTAAVARFAESWTTADFAVPDLPSFYPPAYFWVLGRASALTGIEPWQMLKFGAVFTAFAAPLIAFALWRRVIPERFAAIVAVVMVLVENHYEPYSWLVLAAFVPWWIEVVGGAGRSRTVRSAIGLGAVAGVMAMTYWYMFVIGGIGLMLVLVFEWRFGELERARWRWVAMTGIASAAVSVVYWVPVVVSILSAPESESLGNRWFNTSHPKMELPMFELGLFGLIALVGLGWLAFRWRSDRVASAMAVLLIAGYGWYVLGALAVVADRPLLSFRGKPLLPAILLAAGVLALFEVYGAVAALTDRVSARRVAVVLAAAAGVLTAQTFIDTVSSSSYTAAARDTPLPDIGPGSPPPAEANRIIEERLGPDAVLVTDRTDIISLFGVYTFLPWSAHYANPAAEFHARIAFLEDVVAASDGEAFVAELSANRFSTIDGLLLAPNESGGYTLSYVDDAFPRQVIGGRVDFPERLFENFEKVPVGDRVLLIP